MGTNNGYNSIEYMKKTEKIYKANNNIFDKTINVLKIYMSRKDWPMCYDEFVEASEEILGIDVEALYIEFTALQLVTDNFKDEDAEEKLEEDFKKDVKLFFKVFYPILEECYSYKKNPLGLSKISQIKTENDNKILRIIRNDRECIDLSMSKKEIKEMVDILNKVLAE